MKYFRIIFAAGILVTGISSCDKNLDETPVGLIDETKLANKKGVEGLLIGAYSLLDGVGLGNPAGVGDYAAYPRSGSNWIYGSICGSEAHKGSELKGEDLIEIVAIERFASTAHGYFMADKWKVVYAGVQRANEVLRMMKKAKDIPETDQVRIAAEARFLRGFYDFEAIRMWNKVPYVDESVTYADGNYYLPNDTLIWGAIEKDFRFAMTNLTGTMNAAGRANKYAAEAFLVKVMLFQAKADAAKYLEAKPLLEDLVNNGTSALGIPYSLLKRYSDNFNLDLKNSSESVFAAQASVNDGLGGLNGNIGDVLNFAYTGPGDCCGFFQPSEYLVNHFKTDAVTGLPDLDHFNDVSVKNDYLIPSDQPFTPYNGTLDPRLDWTVGRRGIPYLDWDDHPGMNWIRDPFETFGPYTPIKNAFYKSQQDHFTDATFWTRGSTANNINLIRFADVLLWAAEVEIEAGSLEKAMDYINQVRARAGDQAGWVLKPTGPFAPYAANYKIGEYTSDYFSTKENARKVLYFERMLELAMEGHRFFDLVRWGIADSEINEYFAKESTRRSFLAGANFKKGVSEYFPIPQTQIDLSAGPDGIPKMKQNPGY